MNGRVVVIGLDGLPWSAWKRVAPRLPPLSDGAGGPLLSCQPPVTIPAWAVAATGRTPGEIGLYGLRVAEGRRPRLARPADVQAGPVWDSPGIRCALVGFPPGSPPAPLNGWRVSCCLAPPGAPWAWPDDLQRELELVVGNYTPDIVYRREDPGAAVAEARAMAVARFRIAAHIARTRPWDLLWLVEMGTDRLQHALGPDHPAVEAHAQFVVECAGALAAEHPDASLLFMSDHGSEAARGTFALNDWLREQGHLALRDAPAPGSEPAADWRKTSAWGWGGYWGKIFVEGRRAALRDSIADGLESLRGPGGFRIRAHRPEELYPVCRGNPPDLLLEPAPGWRVGGTVGHPGLFLDRNDTGPDGAVHCPEGFHWVVDPHRRGRPGLRTLYDVRPFLEAGLATQPRSRFGTREWRAEQRLEA
ncbi:MAG: alkaline phosphatase family protein [Halobacteria archaeon]